MSSEGLSDQDFGDFEQLKEETFSIQSSIRDRPKKSRLDLIEIVEQFILQSMEALANCSEIVFEYPSVDIWENFVFDPDVGVLCGEGEKFNKIKMVQISTENESSLSTVDYLMHALSVIHELLGKTKHLKGLNGSLK